MSGVYIPWPGRRSVGHVQLPGDQCWPFVGFIRGDGYGIVSVQTAHGRTSSTAHRWFWQQMTGRDVPPGFEVDHHCHRADQSCAGGPSCPHRRCVRWSHLTVLPASLNNERAYGLVDTCSAGHLRTVENTYMYVNGPRCRPCKVESQRDRRARARASA